MYIPYYGWRGELAQPVLEACWQKVQLAQFQVQLCLLLSCQPHVRQKGLCLPPWCCHHAVSWQASWSCHCKSCHAVPTPGWQPYWLQPANSKSTWLLRILRRNSSVTGCNLQCILNVGARNYSSTFRIIDTSRRREINNH